MTWMCLATPSAASKVYLIVLALKLMELPGELETSGNRATLTLRTASTNLINTMTPLQSKFRTLGEQIIEGLRLGMISRTPALLAEADRIANQITARIQRALRYNSPSRVMRDRVGKSIPEGIAVGISKYSDAAMDSIDKLGKDLEAAFV